MQGVQTFSLLLYIPQNPYLRTLISRRYLFEFVVKVFGSFTLAFAGFPQQCELTFQPGHLLMSNAIRTDLRSVDRTNYIAAYSILQSTVICKMEANCIFVFLILVVFVCNLLSAALQTALQLQYLFALLSVGAQQFFGFGLQLCS